MHVLIAGEATSVTWFIALFVIMLAVAILGKSIIGNLGFIVVCILGIYFALKLIDVSDLVQHGLVAVFICFIGFSLFQLVTKVEHI